MSCCIHIHTHMSVYICKCPLISWSAKFQLTSEQLCRTCLAHSNGQNHINCPTTFSWNRHTRTPIHITIWSPHGQRAGKCTAVARSLRAASPAFVCKTINMGKFVADPPTLCNYKIYVASCARIWPASLRNAT